MSKRILVVDDDGVMSQFVQLRLKEAGFEVIIANDGEEGLQKTKELKPDLIVLDLHMPKMHGYALCKAVRADPAISGMKVVITSGKGYPVDIKAAKDAGADKYLVKPYPIQELLTAIEDLLGLPPSS